MVKKRLRVNWKANPSLKKRTWCFPVSLTDVYPHDAGTAGPQPMSPLLAYPAVWTPIDEPPPTPPSPLPRTPGRARGAHEHTDPGRLEVAASRPNIGPTVGPLPGNDNHKERLVRGPGQLWGIEMQGRRGARHRRLGSERHRPREGGSILL